MALLSDIYGTRRILGELLVPFPRSEKVLCRRVHI